MGSPHAVPLAEAVIEDIARLSDRKVRFGCIIFSQYRDSHIWLAEQLTEELPDEPIAIYSGPTTSGIMYAGEFYTKKRDELKQMVRAGTLRLMLGTDAASEGLNLQRLGDKKGTRRKPIASIAGDRFSDSQVRV